MGRGPGQPRLGQDPAQVSEHETVMLKRHITPFFASYFKLFMLRTCWEWERDSMLPTSLPHPDSALTIAFMVLQSESSVSLLDTRWGFLPILFNLQE